MRKASETDRICQRDRHPTRRRVLGLLVLIVLVTAALFVWSHRFGVTEDFPDMRDQFKYGSIGSDHPRTRGLPYWLWKALPDMFPPSEVVPEGFPPGSGKKGYEAFGLVTEAGWDRPIGFSKRTVLGIDFVGLNCAFCHVTTIRKAPGDKPEIVLGGTGNGVDIERYFLYLFAVASDKRFTTDKVMTAVLRQNPEMNWLERLVYRHVLIPLVRYYLVNLKQNFDFIGPGKPGSGPGRVDTWAAYKRTFVDPPQRDTTRGVVDFPSIWNQQAREGMRLHWDGDTDILEERNIISALGAVGPNIDYLDYPRLKRITQWTISLLPPRYDDWGSGYKIDWDLAQRGGGVYRDRCATCHARKGDRVGRVEPQQYLRTDKERIKAFTPELANALNQLETDSWKLRHFQPQHGYANMLLDGIWLRAPYLHNGSVPTLRDLLSEETKRPPRFCRGNDVYNWKDVGFDSRPINENGAESCGEFFLYDTALVGNSNLGHPYGTDLDEKDKEALLEYLKTL